MSGTKPLAPGFAAAGAGAVAARRRPACDAGFDLGDRVEPLQHGRADRGAAPGREAVDRGDERLAIGRRRHASAPRSPRRRRGPCACPSAGSRRTSRAASCATASRFGSTSVEHIDRETSSARMIDVRAYGTSALDVRARRRRARARRGSASSRATGRCRCQRFRRGQHRAQQRDARVADGLLAPAAQRSTSRRRGARGRRAARGARAASANDTSDHPPEPDDREHASRARGAAPRRREQRRSPRRLLRRA